MIDLVELRNEIRKGTFTIFTKKDIVYIRDSGNGETVIICNLKEVENHDNLIY